ncbi:hypothetical protein CR492_14555 [Methylocella silvestris]|uniref:Uncharacterized protein n=1 Tax=Methylocella silvestris TaxID=199596 RepID=A0A2J7TEK4_METSI|nr:hypothetical protein CR492_14555 [Methylocella silvestris]
MKNPCNQHCWGTIAAVFLLAASLAASNETYAQTPLGGQIEQNVPAPVQGDEFHSNSGGPTTTNQPGVGKSPFCRQRDAECGGTDRRCYDEAYDSAGIVLPVPQMQDLYRQTQGRIWIRCGVCGNNAICWPRPGYQDLIASNGANNPPSPAQGSRRDGPPTAPERPAKPPCRAPSAEHARLYQEPWLGNPQLQQALKKAGARFQSNKLGSGRDMAFDEYTITVTQMPAGLTPESLLQQLGSTTNATVDGYGPAGAMFDRVTRFVRRQKGPLKLGELIDIEIPGDPGTVQLVELQPDHFVLQTVTSPEMGTHPVSGARQFGFRRVGSNVLFYTKGAERPYNENLRGPGMLAQDNAWRSFMSAIGEMINHWQGVVDLNTMRRDRVDIPCD